jgi:uncharacterized membrane protein YccC
LLIWLRDLAATVFSFDRSALEPGYALRCTIGVAIPLVIASATGHAALGVPAAIGAFITGFTSLQGVYRTRLVAIIAAAAGMSVTSFAGALAAHSTPLLVVVTALAGYAFGTIAQLGPAASTVALNSFVAFVLFSSQPLAPAAAAGESGLVFAGGLIQAALLMLAWPAARIGVERLALSDVYRKLSEYAERIAQGSPSLPPITPFATARQILTDPQPFARSSEVARLNRLLEDSEVIRKRLGAFAGGFESAEKPSGSRAIAQTAATTLASIADALSGRPAQLEIAAQIAGAETNALGGDSLLAQLRDATEAASMLTHGRIPRISLLSMPRTAPYVANRIDWLSRDSLRFAIVLAIAMYLARYFAADRGYWIPLTAAIVLKPDFRTTFVRGFARIGGTLAGALVASLVIMLVRDDPPLQVTGILVAAAAAYLTFNPNYALFTVAITSFVVMVLRMRGLPGTTTIDARLLDTLAGGALAMVGYAALPSWERKRTRGLLADLLDAQREVARAILRAYLEPSSGASHAIDAARTQAWKARTVVEASIDRSRTEPHRQHTIGPARALRILAATQRFALASLALETAAETESPPRVPGLTAFGRALDVQMTELAAALREARRANIDAAFAESMARLDGALATETEPRCRFVLERLRAYGDAASRITRLVGQARA